MILSEKNLVIGGGLLLIGLAIWVKAKGAANVGETVAGGLVAGAGGVFVGTVKGIGGLFGVPDTDATKAAQARAAGDVWGAAAYMPAQDFLRWLAKGAPTGGALGSW